MKRGRDGNVRVEQDEHAARERCLDVLRQKISEPLFRSILHLQTADLLALISDLPPQDQSDSMGAL